MQDLWNDDMIEDSVEREHERLIFLEKLREIQIKFEFVLSSGNVDNEQYNDYFNRIMDIVNNHTIDYYKLDYSKIKAHNKSNKNITWDYVQTTDNAYDKYTFAKKVHDRCLVALENISYINLLLDLDYYLGLITNVKNFYFSLDKTEAIQKSSCCTHYLYCSSIWAHGRSEVLPLGRESLTKEPVCDYGKDKYESEKYLIEKFRKEKFPMTIISPGQISGPGWDIINPWGGLDHRPFQLIADGEIIYLPNFGQETLHHIHGEDVAQLFYKAIINRNQALGEVFNAVSGGSITLYGYAKLLYSYFGKEPKIEFKPWNEFCEYVGKLGEPLVTI